MGGPGKAEYNALQNLQTSQTNLSNYELSQAQQDTTQRNQLMQPQISFDTAITNGSRDATLAANAPQISNITQATTQAKGQIMNNLPPGAARDLALAQTSQGAASQIASTNNQTFTSALSQLSQLGAGLGSFGLSESGQALGASQAATTSENSIVQAKAQKKASTMSAIGSLVGAAGTAAGGGAFGALGG